MDKDQTVGRPDSSVPPTPSYDALQFLDLAKSEGSNSPDPLSRSRHLKKEIGERYEIKSELGKGGFGKVLLAEDKLLKREVAIKILHDTNGHANSDEVVSNSLEEARIVARLHHPGIVPVYDVIESHEGIYCIISQYVEGQTLRGFLKTHEYSPGEAVNTTLKICDALSHAHSKGVVHRDVKPENIILAEDAVPKLLDFGLAKLRSDLATEGLAAGTPGYMSPEQARGEDHLVKEGADIFSLGVVLYEMLNGNRAFPCKDLWAYLTILENGQFPNLPRKKSIPKELERIYLQSMQAQLRSRYLKISEFAEDLRAWSGSQAETIFAPRAPQPENKTPESEPPTNEINTEFPVAVVPRGLRSFDSGDADFFLSLLPGPRDRSGMPSSLRFWKQRIETFDEATAFRVGVIYGPSGCGKSSLVRAGLIPGFAGHVSTLYYESRDSRNSERLHRAIRTKFPQIQSEEGQLPALIKELRKGNTIKNGEKLLIVIDQSEQWLQDLEKSDRTEECALVDSLRQCDGKKVQILMLVRDDFWRSISRTLSKADVELDSRNSSLVDLFEIRHAERVLEKFGRAYRCLPEDPHESISEEAKEFIQLSVKSLAEGLRVSPVRLSVFAEMFKVRDWTKSSLLQVGGVGGIAVTFLEESFHAKSAPAPHRLHKDAARNVLQLFVPDGGNVKGPPAKESLVRVASGYEKQPDSFRSLMKILDGDLRLLTRVDRDENDPGEPLWQLSHDYMVPALREWLLAQEAATIRGRAKIRLRERAAEWGIKPDSERLPGIWEWLKLWVLTSKNSWNEVESKWLNAGLRRARRWGVATAAVLGIGFLAGYEALGRVKGENLASNIQIAPPDQVQKLAFQGKQWMKWARPILQSSILSSDEETATLNARLALTQSDSKQVQTLSLDLLKSERPAFLAITDAIKESPNIPINEFEATLKSETGAKGRRFRAFAALVSLDPKNPLIKSNLSSAANWMIDAVEDPKSWSSLLRPVRAEFSLELETSLSKANSEAQKNVIASALCGLHEDSPGELVRLVKIVPTTAIGIFSKALGTHQISTDFISISDLHKERPIKQDNAPEVLTPAEEQSYLGYAHVILSSLSLEEENRAWKYLKRSSDRNLRTMVVVNASKAGVPPEVFVEGLISEKDPGILQSHLMALWSYPLSSIPPREQERLLNWMQQSYPSHPDGGVHSSIASLFKRWSLEKELEALEAAIPPTEKPVDGMGWWKTPDGIDMRILKDSEGYRVAISACEVTLSDFLKYSKSEPKYQGPYDPSNKNIPVTGTGRNAATNYCNWLSQRQNLPKTEFCYREDGTNDDNGKQSFLRKGFRLPRIIETEIPQAASGNEVWHFGSSQRYLDYFGWHSLNSDGKLNPVGRRLPDDFGLWDQLGNAAEWSHDQTSNVSQRWSKVIGYSYFDLPRNFDLYIKEHTHFNSNRPENGFRLAKSVE